MNRDLITICVSLVIIACTAIVGIAVFNIQDRANMAKNIEAAIAKGVDPLSVKCAYETNPGAVCVTYAISNNQPVVTGKK